MKISIIILTLFLSSCASFNPTTDQAKTFSKRLEALEKKQESGIAERGQILLLVEEKNKILEGKMNSLQKFSTTQGKINEQILIQLQNQNKLLGNFDKKIDDVKFTHYQVLITHADKIYRKKKYQQALFLYDRLLTHRKSLTIEELRLATYRQALINFRFKDYNTSIKQFFDLVTKQGESKYVPSALYHSGIIWIRQKKYEKAIQNFEEIIKNYSHNKRFYNNAKRALRLAKKRLKATKSKSTKDLG